MASSSTFFNGNQLKSNIDLQETAKQYMKGEDNEKPVKHTNGFLYEIKTQAGVLVGHVFGTIHELCREHIEDLNPKILTCFDEASHLFLELEDLNSENIRGVDNFLAARANKQGKSVKGLETKFSREKIGDIDQQKKLLYQKGEAIVLITLYSLQTKYARLVTLLSQPENNPSAESNSIVSEIKTCLHHIQYLVENLEYLPSGVMDKLFDKLIEVFDKIMELLLLFEFISVDKIDLVRKGILNKRRRHDFFNKIDKLDAEEWINKKYINGDEALVVKLAPKDTSSLKAAIKKLEEKAEIKNLQERDAVMAESIHQDLLITVTAEEYRRGFYASGAAHVLGRYPKSLPFLLKEKGWQLSKVELEPTLSAQSYSTCDQLPSCCY